ncbi:MAG: DUF4340 domain-containing protein [Limisphaerales bacterium]
MAWSGNNLISGLHAGKTATNDAALIYARREGWNAIFTTPAAPLSPWHGTVNDFRDPHLLELTAPVAEIEVRGPHDFTLQLHGTNGWQVVGEKFPGGCPDVGLFIQTLSALRVSEFVKDVVSAPDLAAYGLGTPTRQFTLRSAAGDTNAVIAQLAFAVQTTGCLSIVPTRILFIPSHRRIPKFFSGTSACLSRPGSSASGASGILMKKMSRRSRFVRMAKPGRSSHNGLNKWSLAAGSQGIINPPALEETTHRLGELTALGWVAHNVTGAGKIRFKARQS